MTDSAADEPLADAVDLVLLIGDRASLDGFLGAFVQTAGEESTLTPNTIADVGPVSTDLARTVLEFLASRGYGRETSTPEWGIEPRYEACLDLLADARRARRILDLTSDELDTGSFELVCTLPANDPAFQSHDPVDFGMHQITSRLLSLCSAANDSLTILSPFLEAEGIKWLLPGIEGALERGVTVTIVSRELDRGAPNFQALEGLFKVAAQSGGTFALYDYYEGRPDDDRPLYTLHSKVLLVDRNTAYIGSANFTKYGFSENLELGVILRNGHVERLYDLIHYLITEGTVEVHSR